MVNAQDKAKALAAISSDLGAASAQAMTLLQAALSSTADLNHAAIEISEYSKLQDEINKASSHAQKMLREMFKVQKPSTPTK